LRWVDENRQIDMEQSSISSEEAAGSGSDSELRVGARHTQQDIWDRDEVEDGLKALPGSEEISTLLDSRDEAGLVKHIHGYATGLLMASWRGNAHMLTTLLDFGASPSVTDAEGRYIWL
jgi:hypothetical protein